MALLPVERRLTGTTPVLAASGLCALAQSQFLFVLPWIVLARGGSSSSAILSIGTAFLPYVVCSPVAGLFGDRANPRVLLSGTFAVMACAAGSYPLVNLVTGHAPFALAIGGAAVFGIGKPFADAGTYRAIAAAEQSHMIRRQAVNTTLVQAGTFGGPAIGLGLFKWAGATAVYTGVAVMLGCGAGIMLRARLAACERQRVSIRGAARSGINSLRTDARLQRVVISIAAWNLVAGAAFSVVSPLLKHAGVSEAGASGVFLVGAAAVLLLTLPAVRLGLRRLNAAALFATAVGVEGAAFWAFSRALGQGTFALYACFLIANSVAACGATGARAIAIRLEEQALLNVSSTAVASVAYLVGVFVAAACARALALAHVALLVATSFVALGVGLEIVRRRAGSQAVQPADG